MTVLVAVFVVVVLLCAVLEAIGVAGFVTVLCGERIARCPRCHRWHGIRGEAAHGMGCTEAHRLASHPWELLSGHGYGHHGPSGRH